MLFVAIAQHSPAQCPGFNKETFDMVSKTMPRLDDLSKKHKVKILGFYSLLPIHKGVIVMDAPGVEAVENLLIDSRFVAWNTVELSQAHTPEEALKIAAELHGGKR